MKTHLKLLAVAAALAVVCAACLVWIVVATAPLCLNTLVAAVESPRRARKAVVFERSCGATTGFSTQVSVLRADRDLPDDRGNVFVADGDHGAAPEGPGGGPVVDVAWSDENRLVIRHHPRARVFHQERRIDGIEVRYEMR